MKTICLFFLSLLLICAFSPALAAQDLSAIPASILTAAPGVAVEDYLELTGTPGGDWAFLLTYQDARRQMLCFRWEDGAWAYQSTVEKPLPQGDQTGFFIHEEKGYPIDRLWDDTGDYSYISDGTLFGVYTTDGIIYLEGVSFFWQQDGFRLCSYQDHPNAQMDLLDGLLIFYNISNGLDSIHPAHLETRLEEVDFYALPRSPEQILPVSAQGMTILPKEMDCTLSGEKLLFQKNQRCPVYVGPGTMCGWN